MKYKWNKKVFIINLLKGSVFLGFIIVMVLAADYGLDKMGW
jgi:hypothetical protein